MSNENIPFGLAESIPANNIKIIEVYNKLRTNAIVVNTAYQRKLVWKNSHKFNFIDTILRNYPFPEVYLAPGNLDQEKLILTDEIVDGQQRLTTIQDYINGADVFALPTLPIKKFSELSPEEKGAFLNYEVSIRYLKNVTPEQVKEIFQRINKTDYSLNSAERLNARWGDSEFVCFAKQVVDLDFDSDGALFVIDAKIRKELSDFFHGKNDDEGVFSDNDRSRMLAYQYIMTLVATLECDEYFNRDDRVQEYIELYNEGFPTAPELLDRLCKVVKFLDGCKISRSTRWYKKASLFTLIVELDKVDLGKINSDRFSERLTTLDRQYTFKEIGLENEDESMTAEEERYFSLAREAVNEKKSRISRGEFVAAIIQSCTE